MWLTTRLCLVLAHNFQLRQVWLTGLLLLNNRNNSSDTLHSPVKTWMTIIPRNKPQHTSKKPSTRTSILQTTLDLMNPPLDKGKGCAEGKCPNNNPPNGGNDGDDRNGPDSSDDDSDGSKAIWNSAITCLIHKGLSSLFAIQSWPFWQLRCEGP